MVVFKIVSNDSWTDIDKIYQSLGYYKGASFLGFTIRSAKADALDSGGAEELFVLLVREESRETDWYVLGWDSSINTLRVVSSPQINQDQQFLVAESFLFDQGNPEAAIELLDKMLTPIPWHVDINALKYEPYLQYLLGLAYEMNGNKEDAVLAYWNLWHDFPLHPLNYVVQQKLERNLP
jgi:tetratricopeptide (TPR) repeat protein